MPIRQKKKTNKKNSLETFYDVGDSIRQQDGTGNFSPSLSALSLLLLKRFTKFLKSKN